MEYENNGLRGAICDILRLSGIILFGGWDQKYKQPKFIENAAQEDLYQKLLTMVDEGRINEAENEMIDFIEQHIIGINHIPDMRNEQNLKIFEMALCVYGYMNDKEDSFLETSQYSREEIRDGIYNMMMTCGVCIPNIYK